MAFTPKPRTPLSEQQAKWEKILAAEGLPAEIRPLTASSKRDGLRVVSLTQEHSTEDQDTADSSDDWAMGVNLETYGAPTGIADTDTAVHWRWFGQAVHSLPNDYPKRDREFLERLADCGCIDEAAGGRATQTHHRALARFKKWRKENSC